MTFNRKITLISSEQKNGSQGKADRAVKTVYAKVSEPGVTAKYAAETAGLNLGGYCSGYERSGKPNKAYLEEAVAQAKLAGITSKQPERPTATCI